MHRLIMMSSTYRMSSRFDSDDHQKLDPNNRYLWRMNARRMEAEIIRDSVLHVAGRLDSVMGGPELDVAKGETSRRRSVYFRHAPDQRMVFLQLFDTANTAECYRRRESVVPQQALAMSNSSLSLAQARVLAGVLTQRVGVTSSPQASNAFIAAAFECVLGRGPTMEEHAECAVFLREQSELLGNPEQLTGFSAGEPDAIKPAAAPHLRARENLVQVLFNHIEFVTIR